MPASYIETGASAKEESAMARSTSQQSNRLDGPAASEQGLTATNLDRPQDDADSHTSSAEQSDPEDVGSGSEDELQRANRVALGAIRFKGVPPANYILPGQVIGKQIIDDGEMVSQEITYGSSKRGPAKSGQRMRPTGDNSPASPERSSGTGSSRESNDDRGPKVNKAGGTVYIGKQTFNY